MSVTSTKPECQRLFGRERGEFLQQAFEEATGQPCPCRRLEQCPLAVPPRVPTQRSA